MHQLWDQLFTAMDVQVYVRLGLAVLLGGLIGLEREFRGRAAGLRTLIIVCLGATIIMIVSTKLPAQFYTGPGEAVVRVDPGRIAAGIVTGIGFLGAGVVIKLGDIIRGVTTAACIWFVASLGIAIGQGHYDLAVASTAIALVVLWLLHYVEAAFHSALYRSVTVKVDSADAQEIVGSVRSTLVRFKAVLQDLKVSEDVRAGETELCFYIKIRQNFQANDVVKDIDKHPGVRFVSWD
jgi:putative Mg2+ transporter-C (MgtC) family protein